MAVEGDGLPIGLAENADGTAFMCPTCDYFRSGMCVYPDPRLHGKHVDEKECCNRYRNPRMKVLVA